MGEQQAWQGDILSETKLVSSSATHDIHKSKGAVSIFSLRTITI